MIQTQIKTHPSTTIEVMDYDNGIRKSVFPFKTQLAAYARHMISPRNANSYFKALCISEYCVDISHPFYKDKQDQWRQVYLNIRMAEADGKRECNLIRSLYTKNRPACSCLIPGLSSPNFTFSDSHFKNATPLHLAAAIGDAPTIRLLLHYGANVSAPDKHGNTPLHFAAREGHVHIADLLHRQSPVIDMKNDCGETPLHFAVMEFPLFGSMIEKQMGSKIVSWLLGKGADIKTANQYGDFVSDVADTLKSQLNWSR